jgi:hypothetical protein
MIDRLTTALADRYRIERELGAGGMATVYLARDLRHDRDVAIKVLHPDLGATLGSDRFLSEIRTTARLQHPHILPLLDSGSAEGLVYYVMPLVTGETLRAKLDRERQLPIDEALLIAREVADALGYAHGQGIVHRDIKPENILLQNGHALVADFGIALAVQQAGGQRLTQTGLSLGTPQYMSPEQAMGERSVDARSDIYSLGAVTYEMLTGEPPFTGANVQAIVAKVMSEEPEPPTLVRKSLAPSVEAAVLKALAKLPADRFTTATAFADALRELRVSPTPAARTVRPGFDWRLALAVGLVLGAVGAMLVATRRGAPELTNGFMRTQVTFSGQTGLPAITPNGDVLAYVRLRCEQPGHSGFQFMSSDDADAVPCPASLIVQDTGATAPVVVLDHVPSILDVRWLPNGTAVVVAARLDSQRDGIFVVPRLGGATRQIGAQGVFDTHPSGDTVLVARGAPKEEKAPYLVLIAATSGATVDSIPLANRVVTALSWSPDGRFIALFGGGILRIVRRDGAVVDSTAAPNWREAIRWTPSGDGIIAFGAAPARDDAVNRIPVARDGKIAGPSIEVMPRMQTLFRGHFDVARKTGHLVYASGDAVQDIWAFDVAPGPPRNVRQVTNGTTWYDIGAITPDGRALYYTRGDALGDNLYRVSLDSSGAEEAMTARRGNAIGEGARMSADGRRLLVASVEHGTRPVVYEMDLATRREVAIPVSYDVRDTWRAVPFGAHSFVDRAERGNGLVIRDDSGKVRTLFAPNSVRVFRLTVSPDGRSAAVLASVNGTTTIGIVSLSAWDFRSIAVMPPAPFRATLTWSTDGGIYFAGWVPGSTAPTLFRVATSGGAGLVPVMSVLPRCWVASIVVAVNAPRAVCQTHDWRSDIYLATVPGLTR